MKFLFLFIICLLAHPGFCQDEVDELVDEIESTRKEAKKTKNTPEKKTESLEEELKKLGHDGLTVGALMDVRVIDLVQKNLRQSGISKAKDEDIKMMLLEQYKASFMGNFLANNDWALNFAVQFMKDKEALPGILNIFRRKSDITLYTMIWICFVLQTWIIKKLIIRPYWTKRLKASLSFGISAITTTASIACFYFIFEKEVGPAFSILLNQF